MEKKAGFYKGKKTYFYHQFLKVLIIFGIFGRGMVGDVGINVEKG